MQPWYVLSFALATAVSAQRSTETDDASLAAVSPTAQYKNILSWKYPRTVTCALRRNDGRQTTDRDFSSSTILRMIQDSASRVSCTKSNTDTQPCVLEFTPTKLQGDPANGWVPLDFLYYHTTVAASKTESR